MLAGVPPASARATSSALAARIVADEARRASAIACSAASLVARVAVASSWLAVLARPATSRTACSLLMPSSVGPAGLGWIHVSHHGGDRRSGDGSGCPVRLDRRRSAVTCSSRAGRGAAARHPGRRRADAGRRRPAARVGGGELPHGLVPSPRRGDRGVGVSRRGAAPEEPVLRRGGGPHRQRRRGAARAVRRGRLLRGHGAGLVAGALVARRRHLVVVHASTARRTRSRASPPTARTPSGPCTSATPRAPRAGSRSTRSGPTPRSTPSRRRSPTRPRSRSSTAPAPGAGPAGRADPHR